MGHVGHDVAAALFSGSVTHNRCNTAHGELAETNGQSSVLGDQIRMTNRDWAFSIEAMRQSLGFDTFVVLNDFAALAHALPVLPAEELEQVGGGASVADAPRALAAPGSVDVDIARCACLPA